MVTYTRQERNADGRFPPALRRGPRQAQRAGAQLPADKDEDGYFLLLASPQIKARRRAAAEEDGDVRHRPLRQHERQEDRAGAGGLEVRAEQPARGRPVQHHRLRQRDRVVPARIAALQRQDPPGGPGIRRRHLRRRQHQYRRRAAHRPGPIAGPHRPTYIVFLTDGIPTAGRDQRAEDRRRRQGGKQGPRADLRLRRRL